MTFFTFLSFSTLSFICNMKIAREIAGRIWAFWALLVFVPSMLVAIIFYMPCFLMKEPAASWWHRSVSRAWMTFFLNLVGCPLKVKGGHYFKEGESYVVVCNHNSLMDVPVTTPFMPHANKTIAKKSFAKVPLFGWIYSLGSVLVDRNSDASRRKSFEEMKRVLALGLDMVIYPEGTRNRSGKPLKEFYDGAFRLAVDSKRKIMPTLIFNTRKVLPASKPFFMLPHKLQMHFLPPVEVEGLSSKELKEKVFKLMWDYYEANSK
ncbi:lysophospholipid acyltransferase family protein [Foetidibacter luteolus]|uniref:lysophospholipid acyltransferase family protein n=1 Tax=Foetidibacter luteolus TaxID=2608880 RepID=UPI001F1C512B|nr:lysophospholipid acyltransferase family protein [Foetidibacter luteolus]